MINKHFDQLLFDLIKQTKNSVSISQKWNLERNYIRGIASLPTVFQIKEGTNVEIPLLCDDGSVVDRKQFSLVKIANKSNDQNLQSLVTNCQFNCISYETSKMEITPQHNLVIKGLTSGLYFLRSKLNTKNFIIRVHSECQIWKHCHQNVSATSSIVIKDKLLLNSTPVPVEKQIRVESLKYESGKCSIQLNPQESYSYTRVHVIAFQFFPNGLSNPYNTFGSSYNNYNIQWVSLNQTNNKYMSNRQLGDEFAYVLDRKVQTRFTGNSLEKPSLSLKRNFIQDTSTESENLAIGQSHQIRITKKEEEGLFERDLSYCESPRAAMECYDEQEIFARDASYCQLEKECKPKKKMAMKSSSAAPDRITFPSYDYSCDQTPINAHLNFLKNPCTIITNLLPNKDGLIEFDANLQRFSALQVIVKTHTHHNVSVFNLHNLVNRDVESRDLRQKTTLQKGKYYSIFRNTEKIMKGQQCKIDDITSTEYSIIDSLNKVFDFQIELSRFSGTFSDSSSGKSYTEEWEFLKKWDTFSQSEKTQKYNNNISHELNFFIYMKDKAFFDNIVKSHLQNKIELTLVDLFLLGRHEELLNKYFHIEILERINPFELCLMVYSLVSKGEKLKAQKLLDCLQVLSKQNISDKEIQKKYFEIILNKQQEKASPGKGGRIPISQAAPAFYSNINYNNNNNNNYDDDNCSESFEGEDSDDDDDNDFSSADEEEAGEGEEEEERQYNYKVEEDKMGYDLFGGNDDDDADMDYAYQQRSYGKGGKGVGKRANRNKNDRKEKSYNFKPMAQQYKQQRQLFQQCAQSLKKTGQYCERHYLNQKDDHFYGKDQITPYQFWFEFAQSIFATSSLANFLSPKFLECNRSHTEMVLIMSILSLPFNSPNHNQFSLQGKDQVIQAADNLLLYTKEIKETSSELKSSIMINQRFFDPNDKYEIQGDEKFEKDAQEFIINYIYGCQVIVTNCTGGQQEIQVLTEVPEGSIPVHTIEYTKSHTQKLDSYSTKIFEFYFYFPSVGTYSIYPANVSKNGQVLCVARDSLFEVKKELTQIQLNTLDQVLTQGTKEDILTFLREKDWQDVNKQKDFKSTFNSIVSMCTDKDFFLKLLEIMREKNFFHFDIWKYSLLHLDHSSLIEFINCSGIRQKISKYISHLNCTLIKQSLNIGEWNRVYEYYPLINSRVHLLKRDSANILNIQFRRTYCHFLKYVVEKGLKNMSGIDRLVFVYYLLLQDRVETAIEQFDKIHENEINTKKGSIQYDYVKAYLDFYKGYPNFKVAREIIEKYLDYPITSWRNLFYDMANQLAEYDGEDMIDQELKNLNISGDVTLKKEDKVQTEKQQVLSLRFDEKKIIIEHKNIPQEITLTYYKIDLEVFFSKKPFLSNISEDFSYLQPTFTQVVSLNEEDKNQSAPTVSKFDMPELLQSTNVYIQAISGPFLKAGVTYFSTQLKVSLFSDDAYLKITDQNNSLLSKIYVKVFSKNKSGKIDFIKDGYTDLRGRFEYLLSSSVNINDIDRLSLFIMSDDLGSLILEAKPPKRIGQFTETIELKSRNWAQKYETKVQNKKK